MYLTSGEVPLIENTTVGVNNKILIPPPGVNKIHFPQFDVETNAWIQPSEEVRPIRRTYTHRGVDLVKNEIWIDFVAHGEEGPVSAWAINAVEGDVLGVLMKPGKSNLYPPADWYLFAGDATAIPVLGAILDSLPPTARGICIIEVHGKEDEQPLSTKADIDFIWLHNQQPQKGSRLIEVVKEQQLPGGSRFGYVAAEFSSVRAIRNYLRKEKAWAREELYAYSYWKAGVAEDKSEKDRRKEKETP